MLAAQGWPSLCTIRSALYRKVNAYCRLPTAHTAPSLRSPSQHRLTSNIDNRTPHSYRPFYCWHRHVYIVVKTAGAPGAPMRQGHWQGHWLAPAPAKRAVGSDQIASVRSEQDQDQKQSLSRSRQWCSCPLFAPQHLSVLPPKYTGRPRDRRGTRCWPPQLQSCGNGGPYVT